MSLSEVILYLDRLQINVLESVELRAGLSRIVHPSQIVRQNQVFHVS